MTGSSSNKALQIPEATQQKFSELITLIVGSESMNDEERQYWINILPVMTPDQLKSLKDILDNEKKQLKAIDEKYSKEMEKIAATDQIAKVSDDRRKKKDARLSSEATDKQAEEKQTEEILKQIEGGSTASS